MRTEAFFYLGIMVVFAAIGVVYWFVSYEDAGTVMLAGTALMGVFAGGYLYLQSRRYPPRLEDRPDATVAEGAGDIDVFPSATYWPLALAFGAAMTASGLVFGIWLVLGGLVFFVGGMIGWIAESRAGLERDTRETPDPRRGSA
jgi:Cytochrome c oxidase subunit IV